MDRISPFFLEHANSKEFQDFILGLTVTDVRWWNVNGWILPSGGVTLGRVFYAPTSFCNFAFKSFYNVVYSQKVKKVI